MRSRCQDNTKPMSRRMRSRCQDECEADIKTTRSRCQEKCEADVKKALTDRHLHAQTSTPDGSTHTHKRIDARWKHADKYFPSMFAVITSIPSISLA